MSTSFSKQEHILGSRSDLLWQILSLLNFQILLPLSVLKTGKPEFYPNSPTYTAVPYHIQWITYNIWNKLCLSGYVFNISFRITLCLKNREREWYLRWTAMSSSLKLSNLKKISWVLLDLLLLSSPLDRDAHLGGHAY